MTNVLRSPQGGNRRESGRGVLVGKREVEGGRGRGSPRYHLTYEGDRLNIN